MKRIFSLLIGIGLMSGCLEGPGDEIGPQQEAYAYKFSSCDVVTLRWPGEFKADVYQRCMWTHDPSGFDEVLYPTVIEVATVQELTDALVNQSDNRIVKLKSNINLDTTVSGKGNFVIEGPGKLTFGANGKLSLVKVGAGRGCFYTTHSQQTFQVDQSVRITAPVKNLKVEGAHDQSHVVIEGLAEGLVSVTNAQAVVFVGRSFDINLENVFSAIAFNASIRGDFKSNGFSNTLTSNSKLADFTGASFNFYGCSDAETQALSTNVIFRQDCQMWNQVHSDWISCGGTK